MTTTANEELTATGHRVWRNRIVGYAEVDPTELLANPKNWRIHPKFQQDSLAGVLDEVGFVQDVVVNKATGFVVDGHLRVALALQQSQPTIPVKYVDLTEEEEAKVLWLLDTITGQAVPDPEKLAELMAEIETSNEALTRLMDDLTKQIGHVGAPPSLDDLANTYGEPNERDFWPVIKVQVAPETQEHYRSLMEATGCKDEADAFRALLAAVDTGTLAQGGEVVSLVEEELV